MKAFLLSIAFAVISNEVFSQLDATPTLFEDAIRSLEEPDIIIYVDSAMTFYQTLGRNVQGYAGQQKLEIRFKNREIKFLRNEFKKKVVFVWPGKLLTNSIRTTYDSAELYRQKYSPERTVKKDKRYFLMSRTVYFRNNSFFVFRLAEMFGDSAGNDFLFFYRKVEYEWKSYMRTRMGAW